MRIRLLATGPTPRRDRLDLGGQALREIGVRRAGDDLERLERGGIEAARLGQHGLARLAGDEARRQRVLVDRQVRQHALPARGPLAAHGDPARDAQQVLGVGRAVRQPQLQRLARRVELAVQDRVERGGHADLARQALAAAPAGQDAELRLGQADPRLFRVRQHDEVAGQCQLAGAARSRAADRRDADEAVALAREARDALEDLLAQVHHAREQRRVGQLGQRVDVGAGRELLRAAPRDHQPAQQRVALDRVERGVEIGEQRHVEDRQRAVRGIERQLDQPRLGPLGAHAGARLGSVLGLGQAGRVDHAPHLSSTKAPPWPPPMHSVASA
jgi:hypothetical protein